MERDPTMSSPCKLVSRNALSFSSIFQTEVGISLGNVSPPSSPCHKIDSSISLCYLMTKRLLSPADFVPLLQPRLESTCTRRASSHRAMYATIHKACSSNSHSTLKPLKSASSENGLVEKLSMAWLTGWQASQAFYNGLCFACQHLVYQLDITGDTPMAQRSSEPKN